MGDSLGYSLFDIPVPGRVSRKSRGVFQGETHGGKSRGKFWENVLVDS